jgi:hypothetical protein
MIKAGTLCILIHANHDDHIGHLMLTKSDSFVSPGSCVCGCGLVSETQSRNWCECLCGDPRRVSPPEKWLWPLPPLAEEESRERELVYIDKA